jgi:hypothetical protein
MMLAARRVLFLLKLEAVTLKRDEIRLNRHRALALGLSMFFNGLGGNYSITSSARLRIDGGTVRPRALAVFRLTTSSKMADWWTGKSAGLAPLRIVPA